MTLLIDLLIVLSVAGALAMAYVLTRLAAGADAHIELLTPAVRERLRRSAQVRQLPRLHGGRSTGPFRPV